MKKIETAIYQIVALILIYLALAILRYFISFLLRHCFLLIALVAAMYFAYRRCKSGSEPWWWVKAKGMLLRFRRSAKQ